MRPQVPAGGDQRGQRGDPPVLGRAARVLGQVADLGGQPRHGGPEQVGLDRVDQALGLALHQHAAGGRAHPEVALDGAPGHPVGRPSARRWSPSRRRPPAPGAGRSGPARPRPARTASGGRRAHQPAEPRRDRRPAPAEHVPLVQLHQHRPGRAGHHLAAPRGDVVAGQHGAPGRPQQRLGVRAGRGVAGQQHRVADPGPGQPPGVVQQAGRVVAVGPAEQQHHPGPGAAQQPHVRGLQRAGVHVHHVRPRRAGHPVPGLGAGQPLGADHGQPQPAAGRRAGQQLRLAGRAAGRGRRDRPHRRVHPGEHVGRGGRVLGESGQRAVRTDQYRLGPGGANVEADRGGLFGGHAHRP